LWGTPPDPRQEILLHLFKFPIRVRKENAGPALRRSGVETSAIGHDGAWPSDPYFLGSLGLISFSGMPASLLAMFFFSSMG
jgi:hypothetical protein